MDEISSMIILISIINLLSIFKIHLIFIVVNFEIQFSRRFKRHKKGILKLFSCDLNRHLENTYKEFKEIFGGFYGCEWIV